MISDVSELTFGYIFGSLAIPVFKNKSRFQYDKKMYLMCVSLKMERISFDQFEHFFSYVVWHQVFNGVCRFRDTTTSKWRQLAIL
jgi:hypothetical protein